MNTALERLARELDLHSAGQLQLRLAFGHACAERVRHLLEDPEVVRCLDVLAEHVRAGADADASLLERTAAEAARLANQHPGSKSIDGCGHAAVSATYAVANAMAGKALQAADYAAYAAVYGQGGYGAVAERASFEPEFAWQADCLAALAERRQA